MPNPHPASDVTLDTERGVRQAGGRQALYLTLLRLFAQHHETTPASLQQLLAAGDLATARRVAHTLRGSAAQIGAAAVERHAGLVEDAVRAGASVEAITALLQPLGQSVVAVMGLLRTQSPDFAAWTAAGQPDQGPVH